MSDVERRAVERNEPGSGLELRQRLRAGEAGLIRVPLAAWLGYEPAIEAVEPAVLDVPAYASNWSPVRKALAFGDLGPTTFVGLACDFVDHVHAEASCPQQSRAVLVAVRAWVACPCEEHRQAAAWAAWLARPGFRAVAPAVAPAELAAKSATESWVLKAAELAADTAQAAARAAIVTEDEERWQAEHMAQVLCDARPKERRS